MKFASPCLFVDDVEQTIEFYKKAFNAEEKFFDSEFGFAVMLIDDSEIGIASHTAGGRMMSGKYPFSESSRVKLRTGPWILTLKSGRAVGRQ